MGYLCLLSNTYYEPNKNNKMQSSSNRNIKRKLFYFSSFWPHPIPAYRWKSQLVVCSCWGWRCASLSPTLCFSLFYFSVCVCVAECRAASSRPSTLRSNQKWGINKNISETSSGQTSKHTNTHTRPLVQHMKKDCILKSKPKCTRDTTNSTKLGHNETIWDDQRKRQNKEKNKLQTKTK